MKNGLWVQVRSAQKPIDPPLFLKVCGTFSSRLRGFLFSPPPSFDRGLLFWYSRPSRWDSGIHMLGVPFPLAAIWLDDQRVVIDRRIAHPWQIALIPQKEAQYVIECHPQRLKDFPIGLTLDFLEK
ncbi:MAG: DUF192 domain-containing protein [Anaerolineales bacterium]|nr:DUF192 domain-containing protein [Anaerolineales bacterium]